jgi:hypothetical protein
MFGQINLPPGYRPQGLGMPGSLPPTFGQLQAGMPMQPGFGGGGFDQSFGTSPAPMNAAGQPQSWTDFYGLPPVGTSSGVKFGQSVGGMPSLMAMNNGSALPTPPQTGGMPPNYAAMYPQTASMLNGGY